MRERHCCSLRACPPGKGVPNRVCQKGGLGGKWQGTTEALTFFINKKRVGYLLVQLFGLSMNISFTEIESLFIKNIQLYYLLKKIINLYCIPSSLRLLNILIKYSMKQFKYIFKSIISIIEEPPG